MASHPGLATLSWTFIAPRVPSIAAPAVLASMAPVAAQALEMPEAGQLEKVQSIDVPNSHWLMNGGVC